MDLSLPKKIVFALLPTVLLLVGAEVFLRWKGSADRCPGYEANFLWVCDPLLYFRNNPGQIIAGKPLNRAGFRAPEFSPPRPGVTQVLVLGDSCTFGVISPDQANGLLYVEEPYAERLQRLADEKLGAGRVQVWNAGVPGYNTWQGIMLLRGPLRDLRPNVITVRYGWNDLAMSNEQAIDGAFVESDSAVVRFGEDLLLRTKLYPFARRLGMELRQGSGGGVAGSGTFPKAWHPNVPVERYERNLRRIVEIGRGRGAEVWLLTSPDPFATAEDIRRYAAAARTSSAYLTLATNGIPNFERLAEIHAEYNDAVRRVAHQTGAPLVDLAAVFRHDSAARLFTSGDVIHPNDAGHRVEAEILFARLDRLLRR